MRRSSLPAPSVSAPLSPLNGAPVASEHLDRAFAGLDQRLTQISTAIDSIICIVLRHAGQEVGAR